MAAFATLLVSPPPAQASSTLLCRGFTGCFKAGYPNFGYAGVYRQMFWRMYSGHNCTNYMAYRMIQAGMPATRPWSGSGNARNWGVVFASKTNQTPMVGSVAWWSANHVAYVEQVVDANTIVISEDHYGGDFDWRRIVRSGGGWPTGFIHLRDVALKTKVAPAITGTAQVGQSLTANAGTWTPAPAATSYQWTADGVAIPGATGRTLAVGPAQLGKAIGLKVGARKPSYVSGSSLAKATAAVVPGVMQPTQAPVVSGIPKVGAVLTATTGTWSPAPTSMVLGWRADGVPIPGATGTTLRLGPAQLNKRITAVTVAKRAGYTDAIGTSAATAPVGPEKLTMAKAPSLTGLARVGGTLVVTPGQVTPAATVSYQWFRDDEPVAGMNVPRYPVTSADLGHVIGVKVSFTRPGYTTVERTLRAPIRTRSIPNIRVRPGSMHNVGVAVTAAGISPVHALVRISEGGKVSRWRTLDGGRTVFSPDWLRPGTHRLTVHVLRTPWVEARAVTVTVVVR